MTAPAPLVSPSTFNRLVDDLGAELATEILETTANYREQHTACVVQAIDIVLARDADTGDPVDVQINYRHSSECQERAHHA